MYEDSGFPYPKNTLDSQVSAVTLGALRRHFISKSDEKIADFLSRYLNRDLIGTIKQFINLRELCSLLAWLERTYVNRYGEFTLDVFLDPDEGFQFLEISFPHGEWDEWKILAKEIKVEMANFGMHDLASKVAIVCLKALQGPQS